MALASVSHEELIRSGNVVHTSMHVQYLELKFQVAAKRYVIVILTHMYAHICLLLLNSCH